MKRESQFLWSGNRIVRRAFVRVERRVKFIFDNDAVFLETILYEFSGVVISRLSRSSENKSTSFGGDVLISGSTFTAYFSHVLPINEAALRNSGGLLYSDSSVAVRSTSNRSEYIVGSPSV